MYALNVDTIEFRTEVGEVEEGKAKITIVPKPIDEAIKDGTLVNQLKMSVERTENIIKALPNKGWVIQSHSLLPVGNRLVISYILYHS